MSLPKVSFRPHHLLCMLTYQSQGYSDAFVKRFDDAVAALNQGAPLQLCRGPDTLCETVLNDEGCHCLNDSVELRDKLALKAVSVALGYELRPESCLTLSDGDLAVLRAAFADGRLRGACDGCEWSRLCSRIARQGFQEVRLYPHINGEDSDER